MLLRCSFGNHGWEPICRCDIYQRCESLQHVPAEGCHSSWIRRWHCRLEPQPISNHLKGYLSPGRRLEHLRGLIFWKKRVLLFTVKGLEIHGIAEKVISRGVLAYEFDGDKFHVEQGHGKYVPRQPYSGKIFWKDSFPRQILTISLEYVYNRIHQREKFYKPEKVEREPYTGPVIKLPQ